MPDSDASRNPEIPLSFPELLSTDDNGITRLHLPQSLKRTQKVPQLAKVHVSATNLDKAHLSDTSAPQWTTQQVITYILMRTNQPDTLKRTTTKPMSKEMYDILDRLIPTHVGIYFPYASAYDIRYWKIHGNSIIAHPSPGQDTADVGDIIIYTPPPGNSTQLSPQ